MFPEVVACIQTNMTNMRTKQALISLDDIKPLFHLPLAHAARILGVCGTFLKTACRRVGVKRWPYRTLQKQDRERANELLHKSVARDQLRAEIMAEIMEERFQETAEDAEEARRASLALWMMASA